ncbi:hypothetical protein RCL1_004677 [Eukaryota sp. TZLM3-RCL]
MIVTSFSCGIFDVINDQVIPYQSQGTASILCTEGVFLFLWSALDQSKSVEHFFAQGQIPKFEKLNIQGMVYKLFPLHVTSQRLFIYFTADSDHTYFLNTFTPSLTQFVELLRLEQTFPALNSVFSFNNLKSSSVLTDSSLKEFLPPEDSLEDTLSSPQWSSFLSQFESWCRHGLLEYLCAEYNLNESAAHSFVEFFRQLNDRFKQK